MEAIEEYKPELEGVLPQDEYFRLTRSAQNKGLAQRLLKIFSDIPLDAGGDLFGKIYEYFLANFAMSEGQGGGEFFTPRSVVKLMVEIIEPHGGKVFDPACGSGGMFVQSAEFIAAHRDDHAAQGKTEDSIYVYGQEKTLETVKLAKMNLAVNGLHGSVMQANTYTEDPHGNVAINKIPLATNQACCNFTLNPKIADYRFVYHYLKGSYSNLVGLKLGGSQQNLNAATLKAFPINVPSLETQHKIAAILSSYDDLIANNQRRITLLERMAEDIYREWFIRLRFPGHVNATIEKGVPQGWSVQKFRDVVQFYIGGGWGEEVSSPIHRYQQLPVRSVSELPDRLAPSARFAGKVRRNGRANA